MNKIQAIEGSLTLSPPLIEAVADYTSLNTVTRVIGVTSQNLNDIGNAFANALGSLGENEIKPTASPFSYELSARKHINDQCAIELYAEVIQTDNKTGTKKTVFSQLAGVFYQDGPNYIRTSEVKATEKDKKTQ